MTKPCYMSISPSPTLGKPNNLACPHVGIHWRNIGDDQWNQSERSLCVNPAAKKVDLQRHDALFPTDFDIAIIDARANTIRKCMQCRTTLITGFQMPEFWWSDYYRNSNGYFGCEETMSADCNITGFNTWARFMIKGFTDKRDRGIDYHWHKLNVFTRWFASKSTTVLLLFDAPHDLVERLKTALQSPMRPGQHKDAFWVYIPLIEEIIRLQDKSVWFIRNRVREMEKQEAAKEWERPKAKYRSRHDVARHSIHVSETLDIAINTINGIISQHKDFVADFFSPNDKIVKHASKVVHQRLLSHQNMIECLKSRSTSNKSRLLNEINLTFNTVAQYDSAIAVEIGLATQQDSSTMKTVTLLTLTFLPATFVSAIFSMSFFDYDSSTDTWAISSRFWIYWAFVLPITAVTFAVWHYWRQLFPVKKIGYVANAHIEKDDDMMLEELV